MSERPATHPRPSRVPSAPRARPRSLRRLAPGALAVVERDVIAWRHSWWVILSGVFEPIFYLLGMGFGLGRLVGDVELEGVQVPFPVFVAAGLLASSAMNGAIFDSTFNFFQKLKFRRTFDAMLYTPLGPGDVVAGEVAWAVVRGGLYGALFLTVAVAFGAVQSWWALRSVPAALLIALTFAALGSFATTYVRAWSDFDLMQLI